MKLNLKPMAKGLNNRTAVLLPKRVQWLPEENKISVKYDIWEAITDSAVGETYVNFTPSNKLSQLMEEEITKAFKAK